MLQRKVEKVLQNRVLSDEVTTSLAALSEFYGKNTLDARRNLSSTLDNRSVEHAKGIIDHFGEVHTQMSEVRSAVDALVSECALISEKLTKAQHDTQHLIQLTDQVSAQEAELASKRELVDTFLGRFHLSEEEQAVLDSDQVSEKTFHVLQRVSSIRADCKELLQRYHQRAGLDILEGLATRLESSYERLYRWVQVQARRLTLDLGRLQAEGAFNLPVFCTALHFLRQRPAYFEHCCQEITGSRRVFIVSRFIEALQQGGPRGTPRPIEIHAHDPVRYTLDILAYVHQALASEQETLAHLVTPTAPLSPEANREEGRVVEQELRTERGRMVQRAFKGICRPMQVRISDSLKTDPSIVTAYELSNIVHFYVNTMAKSFATAEDNHDEHEQRKEAGAGEEHTAGDGVHDFMDTLRSLEHEARASFQLRLKTHMDGLLQNPPSSTSDLSVPQKFREEITRLRRLLEAFTCSFLSPEEQSSSLSSLLSLVVQPLLVAAELCAEGTYLVPAKAAPDGSLVESSRQPVGSRNTPLHTVDRAIFIINIIAALQSVLHSFPLAQPRTETLQLQIEEFLEEVIADGAVGLLRTFGVAELLASVARCKEESCLSQAPGCSVDDMRDGMTGFDRHLFGDSLTQQIQFLGLGIQDPLLRERVRGAVLRLVYGAYQTLHSALTDDSNQYPQDLVQHTPSEVISVLEIDT